MRCCMECNNNIRLQYRVIGIWIYMNMSRSMSRNSYNDIIYSLSKNSYNYIIYNRRLEENNEMGVYMVE